MSLILIRLNGLDGNIEDNVIRSIFLDQLSREYRAIFVATELPTSIDSPRTPTEWPKAHSVSYASTVTKENTPSPVEIDIQQLITSIPAFFKKFEKLEKK